MFVVRPLAFFNSSTLIPYFLAILYRLSPALTTYPISPLTSGITNFCPKLKLFDVKPLAFFNSSTLIPYFLAILYKLSPAFTIYVFILLYKMEKNK